MKKNNKVNRRQKRTRAKLVKSTDVLRLSVHRTNKGVYAQLIDDTKNKTVLTLSKKHLENIKGTKTEQAKALGILIAKKAKEKKITKAVFDRGSFAYHGRVKAVAEGAREGGLKF